VRADLETFGDSLHHLRFLHHYASCLVWNGRYADALQISADLSAMAARLGGAQAMAYALVAELAVSCYCGHLDNVGFEARRRAAETHLATFDDAYLQNFLLANIGWNEVVRGRVAGARAAADRMIGTGEAMDDPRALGYGTAMHALIAMVIDDFAKAVEMSDQSLGVSRAEFERAIANASRHAALVPLEVPDAVAQVERFVVACKERGLLLFLAGPDTMLGVAKVLEGRITQDLRHIEQSIARREAEGYGIAASWYRLFLCEIYLEILSGKGSASAGVILRNLPALTGVMVFGAKWIEALVAHVRATSDYDPEGHYVARMAMILGMLYQIKKDKPRATAQLQEARRIVAPSGPSPMLARIEAALAELS